MHVRRDGRWLRLSPAAVSSRMCGSSPWHLDEAYVVMDRLGIPAREMHLYFPKDGIGSGDEVAEHFLTDYLKETGRVAVNAAALNAIRGLISRL